MASGQPAGAPSYSAYTEGVVAAAADSQGQSQGSGSEESQASGPDGKAGVRVLTEASDDSKCRSFKDMGLPPCLLVRVWLWLWASVSQCSAHVPCRAHAQTTAATTTTSFAAPTRRKVLKVGCPCAASVACK